MRKLQLSQSYFEILTKWFNLAVEMEQDTEQIILDTARKHFLQKGFSATRMQEIADEAGINKAMLHYYFRSKEKLYQEIISQTLKNIVPRFAKALSAEGSFWEKVEILVETYTHTLIENPEIPVFIMSELAQKKQSFIEELKKHASNFNAIQYFIQQMMMEMQQGNIKMMPPQHLFLNILGMTVFPFIARPIYNTIFNASDEDYNKLLIERKAIILEFLQNALRVD